MGRGYSILLMETITKECTKMVTHMVLVSIYGKMVQTIKETSLKV